MAAIEHKFNSGFAQNHPSENSRRSGADGSHPSENSRRPGTAGHPGKHLGHFKAAGVKPDEASQPLIDKQLNALKGESQKEKETDQQRTEADQQQKPVAADQQQKPVTADQQQKPVAADQQKSAEVNSMLEEHMNDMGDAFAEQISFTSKMHAISTGLF